MLYKRGQFFILAAVIISVILVTLASTVNVANINKEPDKFYDLSYQIKQEGADVINFGIYSGNDINTAVANFTGRVGDYLKDTDPEAEMFFIYGNESQVTIENYGKTELSTNAGAICAGRRSHETIITVDSTSTSSNYTEEDYFGKCSSTYNITSLDKNVGVRISNQTYNFTLTQNQQFLIVTKKQTDNETYIDVR